MSGKQSLHWGKGIKKLIDKALNMGYRFEIQGENVIMKFEGKCPPYDKTLYPVMHAIKYHKAAVLEYLKYLEYQEERRNDEITAHDNFQMKGGNF